MNINFVDTVTIGLIATAFIAGTQAWKQLFPETFSRYSKWLLILAVVFCTTLNTVSYFATHVEPYAPNVFALILLVVQILVSGAIAGAAALGVGTFATDVGILKSSSKLMAEKYGSVMIKEVEGQPTEITAPAVSADLKATGTYEIGVEAEAKPVVDAQFIQASQPTAKKPRSKKYTN